MVFLLSAGAFIISFFSMFIGSLMASSYSSVYFSSLTYVYPFFLGKHLATVVGVRQTSDLVKQFDRMWDLRQKSPLVFIAGLLVLVLLTFFVKFTYLFAYLFGFLLASLAAVTMILLRVSCMRKRLRYKNLGSLHFSGYQLRGLSLPLAFYIIFSQLMSNLPAVILTIIFSYFFAIPSFYIIEPLIAGKSNRFNTED